MTQQQLKKQQQLDALYAPYQKCMQCPLATLGRSKMVFGTGNPDARLMLIGEGPGEQEDLQGKPFVGRSGALLNQIFETLGIKREDIFITNIVKCRPPKNRKPYPEESNTCKMLLLEKQIEIIAPRIICTLGSAALQGLLQEEFKITKIHGTILSYRDTPLIPAYHPAYILRNPKELEALVKDLQLAISYL